MRRPCVDREEKRVTRGSEIIRTGTYQEQLDLPDPNQRRLSGHSSAARDLGPDREGSRTGGSVFTGRKVIATEVEEVVDLIVRREEPLRLAG